MAVVQLNYEENASTLDEYLRYCQLIADAFSKSLDQNECNIKVVIGIAQELTNQKNEVEDLWEFMKPDVYIPPTGTSSEVYQEEDGTSTVVEDEAQTISAATVSAIKNKIKESCYYRDLIEVLNNATEQDLVVLNINSGGGMLDSAISIIDALRNTRANTLAWISGSAYSAAGLVALSCQNVEVGEFATLMCHNSQYRCSIIILQSRYLITAFFRFYALYYFMISTTFLCSYGNHFNPVTIQPLIIRDVRIRFFTTFIRKNLFFAIWQLNSWGCATGILIKIRITNFVIIP